MSWLGQIAAKAEEAAKEAAKKASETATSLQQSAQDAAQEAARKATELQQSASALAQGVLEAPRGPQAFDVYFEEGGLGFRLEGARVVNVDPDGQAATLGVKVGDQITAVAGEPLPEPPAGLDDQQEIDTKLKRIVAKRIQAQPRPVCLTFESAPAPAAEPAEPAAGPPEPATPAAAAAAAPEPATAAAELAATAEEGGSPEGAAPVEDGDGWDVDIEVDTPQGSPREAAASAEAAAESAARRDATPTAEEGGSREGAAPAGDAAEASAAAADLDGTPRDGDGWDADIEVDTQQGSPKEAAVDEQTAAESAARRDATPTAEGGGGGGWDVDIEVDTPQGSPKEAEAAAGEEASAGLGAALDEAGGLDVAIEEPDGWSLDDEVDVQEDVEIVEAGPAAEAPGPPDAPPQKTQPAVGAGAGDSGNNRELRAKEPLVLETPEEVRELLSGKRVLHVKGFGSGFGDPPEEQRGAQRRQDEAAAQAIERFRPDYLVVDGDPWGSGFQRYVKAYADRQVDAGLAVPELVWVKNVKGSSPTPEEREKRIGQVREWVDQGLPVVVSWLPEASIAEGVDRLFGAGCWEKLQEVKFDVRGTLKLTEPAEPDRPEWLRGLTGTAPGRELYKAIEDVEGRAEKQYFEKCSFENAAKGNAIYQHLRGEGHAPAAHGAVSFGGGESVLLEFATLYLFPGSGFDAGQAALFPFSRGRPSDPPLPAHEGYAFKSEKQLPVEADEPLDAPYQTPTFRVDAKDTEDGEEPEAAEPEASAAAVPRILGIPESAQIFPIHSGSRTVTPREESAQIFPIHSGSRTATPREESAQIFPIHSGSRTATPRESVQVFAIHSGSRTATPRETAVLPSPRRSPRPADAGGRLEETAVLPSPRPSPWRADACGRLEERALAAEREAQRLSAELAAAREEAHAELEAGQERLRQECRERAELQEALAKARDELEAANEGLRQQSQQRGGLEEALAKARDELEAVRDELDGLRQQSQQRGGLEEALAKARDELDAARDELDGLRQQSQQRGGLEEALAKATEDLQSTTASLGQEREQSKLLREELAKATEDSQSAKASLGQEREQSKLLREELAKAGSERARADSERQSEHLQAGELASQELERSRAEAVHLRRSLERAAAEAEEAKAEEKGLEARLAGALQDCAAQQERGRRAERELGQAQAECQELLRDASGRAQRAGAAQALLEGRVQALQEQLGAATEEAEEARGRGALLSGELSALSAWREEARSGEQQAADEYHEALEASGLREQVLETEVARLHEASTAAEARTQAARGAAADAERAAAEARGAAAEGAEEAQAADSRAAGEARRAEAAEAELERLRAEARSAADDADSSRQLARSLRQTLADQERLSQAELERARAAADELRSEVAEARARPPAALPAGGAPPPRAAAQEAPAASGEDCPQPASGAFQAPAPPPECTEGEEKAALHARIEALELRCVALQKKLNARPITSQGVLPENQDPLKLGGALPPLPTPTQAASSRGELASALRVAVEQRMRRFTEGLLRHDKWLWVFYGHLLVLYVLCSSCLANSSESVYSPAEGMEVHLRSGR